MDEEMLEGFNTDFMSDDEVNEMIDSIVVTMNDVINEDETGVSVLDANKLKQIQFTYLALRYMSKGSRAKVTYTLNEPYTSVGYVSITGRNIKLKHPEWFAKIADYASNVEVYPKTNGTVQINFTFHGLTRKIES